MRSNSKELDDILSVSEKRPRVEKVLKDPRELAKTLMRDLKHYEATGNRSDELECLRKALSGIPPTSVEAGKHLFINRIAPD